METRKHNVILHEHITSLDTVIAGIVAGITISGHLCGDHRISEPHVFSSGRREFHSKKTEK